MNKEQENIKQFLSFIGENIDRKGLIDTPRRVAEMWKELYKGYNKERKPVLTAFENYKDGIHYDQLITDKGYFFSTCEHHCVPFFGSYFFGYIPSRKIIGLSKVSRIVDWYASKLQIQERLTKEIADELFNLLKPKGLIVILKARHLCKEMRGVKQVNGQMTTSDVRGILRKDPSAKREFLSLIKD